MQVTRVNNPETVWIYIILTVRVVMIIREEKTSDQLIERKQEEKMKGMKETAANVAASATAGMEKTKATVQEKVYHFDSSFPFYFFQLFVC